MTSAQESLPLLPSTKSTSNPHDHYAAVDVPVEAGSSPEEEVPQTIDGWGSFALIMNNMTGPAMLGFPHLFQQAGIIPTCAGIGFVYLCASLCGTFLADSIASIPGNQDFSKHIDFSSAFRYTVGEDWYVVAETLFLISCCVQAFAGIVGAAQSLDGFLASFLLGETYAIQFYPTVEIVRWTTEHCPQGSTSVDECTPFGNAGPLVLTLGFVLTTCLFLPLGRGHLKETIVVQLLSFAFMLVLLVQFSTEFIYYRGLEYSLPWLGPDWSQLAGVILFNYAFSITVPSWLNEKERSVSVNRIVWSASTFSSLIYVGFGILGAMAFQSVSPNILILLASNQVHLFTRLCAALFGVTIIGCGVPVFCVIIRTALQHNKVCSPSWALFIGSLVPYMLCWMLYQGSLLMSMLNWTGLVVNGLVAFLLPMVLALKSTELRRRRAQGVEMIIHAKPGVALMHGQVGNNNNNNNNSQTMRKQEALQDVEEGESLLPQPQQTQPAAAASNKMDKIRKRLFDEDAASNASNAVAAADEETNRDTATTANSSSGGSNASSAPTSIKRSASGGFRQIMSQRASYSDTVQPLPTYLELYRREIVLFMMLSFATMIVITIMEDMINGIALPDTDRGARRVLF